jgi:outer membrane immunogenic protein
MRHRHFIAVLIAIAFPGVALAADYLRPPVAVIPSVWTGPYIGIAGGVGWGARDFRWLGGAYAGSSVAYGPNMVIGIEADAFAIDSTTQGNTQTQSTQIRTPWQATVRGRIGYASYHAMLYFTGGLAVGRLEQITTVQLTPFIPGTPPTPATFATTTDNATKIGWTVGVGVEANMRPTRTGRIEYRYTDLGGAFGRSSDVLMGVSFKFR